MKKIKYLILVFILLLSINTKAFVPESIKINDGNQKLNSTNNSLFYDGHDYSTGNGTLGEGNCVAKYEEGKLYLKEYSGGSIRLDNGGDIEIIVDGSNYIRTDGQFGIYTTNGKIKIKSSTSGVLNINVDATNQSIGGIVTGYRDPDKENDLVEISGDVSVVISLLNRYNDTYGVGAAGISSGGNVNIDTVSAVHVGIRFANSTGYSSTSYDIAAIYAKNNITISKEAHIFLSADHVPDKYTMYGLYADNCIYFQSICDISLTLNNNKQSNSLSSNVSFSNVDLGNAYYSNDIHKTENNEFTFGSGEGIIKVYSREDYYLAVQTSSINNFNKMILENDVTIDSPTHGVGNNDSISLYKDFTIDLNDHHLTYSNGNSLKPWFYGKNLTLYVKNLGSGNDASITQNYSSNALVQVYNSSDINTNNKVVFDGIIINQNNSGYIASGTVSNLSNKPVTVEFLNIPEIRTKHNLIPGYIKGFFKNTKITNTSSSSNICITEEANDAIINQIGKNNRIFFYNTETDALNRMGDVRYSATIVENNIKAKEYALIKEDNTVLVINDLKFNNEFLSKNVYNEKITITNNSSNDINLNYNDFNITNYYSEIFTITVPEGSITIPKNSTVITDINVRVSTETFKLDSTNYSASIGINYSDNLITNSIILINHAESIGRIDLEIDTNNFNFDNNDTLGTNLANFKNFMFPILDHYSVDIENYKLYTYSNNTYNYVEASGYNNYNNLYLGIELDTNVGYEFNRFLDIYNNGQILPKTFLTGKDIEEYSKVIIYIPINIYYAVNLSVYKDGVSYSNVSEVLTINKKNHLAGETIALNINPLEDYTVSKIEITDPSNGKDIISEVNYDYENNTFTMPAKTVGAVVYLEKADIVKPEIALEKGNNNRIVVSYQDQAKAYKYRIYYNTDSKKISKVYKEIIVSDNEAYKTSYILSSLTYGSKYYVKVRIYDENNNYVDSDILSLKVIPNAVVNLNGTVSSSKITLTYDKVSGSGYEIYRSTVIDGTYSKIGTVTKNSTLTYSDSSIKNNKTYFYKVRAYKTVNGKKVYGKFSEIITKLSAPKAPTISVKNIDYKTNKISFNAISGATKYNIYRSTDNKTYSLINTIEELEYTDENLINSITYYYKVKAVNNEDTLSKYSNVVNYKPMLKKPVIDVLANEWNERDVEINTVLGADGYEIYHSTDNKKWTKAGETITTQFFDNIKLNKKYYVKVKAYRVVDTKRYYSSYSSVKTITIKLKTPVLTTTRSSVNTIAFEFNTTDMNVKYILYRGTNKDKITTKVYEGYNTNFLDTLTINKTYYYQLQVSKEINGVTYYSSKSSIKTVKISPKTPAFSSSNLGEGVELVIDTDLHNTGYIIYRSTSKTGTFKEIARIDTNVFVDENVTNNRTYYYKIKPIINYNSKDYFGSLSNYISRKFLNEV